MEIRTFVDEFYIDRCHLDYLFNRNAFGSLSCYFYENCFGFDPFVDFFAFFQGSKTIFRNFLRVAAVKK